MGCAILSSFLERSVCLLVCLSVFVSFLLVGKRWRPSLSLLVSAVELGLRLCPPACVCIVRVVGLLFLDFLSCIIITTTSTSRHCSKKPASSLHFPVLDTPMDHGRWGLAFT